MQRKRRPLRFMGRMAFVKPLNLILRRNRQQKLTDVFESKESEIQKISGNNRTLHIRNDEVLSNIRDDIPVTLLMKFSRPLPIDRIRDEYRGVLERRMQKLNGDPDDPQLLSLIKTLAKRDIPSSTWISGDNYSKGTEMAFTRYPGGKLVGTINGQQVVNFSNNEKLCDAFFDVYLGSHPISSKCRQQVGDFLKNSIQNDCTF